MSKIYIPTKSPNDWKQFLAEPETQWKSGYSAKELAECWESSNGFPMEFKKVFSSIDNASLKKQEFIIGIPEFKVPLPGGRKASQNDLFVISRALDEAITSIMIEGKVSESFGPTIGEWLKDASDGKMERLTFLKYKLGLEAKLPPEIRYQLLHRTVSAIIMAEKLNAKYAMMIVHSFSNQNIGFSDYKNYVKLFNKDCKPNQIIEIKDGNMKVYVGWVSGSNSQF